MIIGLLGNKQSGKTTASKWIQDNYDFQPYEFARPIKEICKSIFGFTNEQLNGSLKEQIDSNWGITPRRVMQWIGTEMGQFRMPTELEELEYLKDRTLWVEIFIRRHDPFTNYVISDVRFPHEIKRLKEFDHRTKIIKLKTFKPNKDLHKSEMEVEICEPDYVIDNNPMEMDYLIEQLHPIINEIIEGYKHGN